MKVSKVSLLKFIDLLRIKGDLECKTILVKTSEGKIEVPIAVPESNVIIIRGSLTGTDIKDIGELGIDDLKLLRGFISTFNSNNILMDKKTNKLELSSDTEKLKISAILRDPKYIMSLREGKTFDMVKEGISDNIFTLDREQIKQIINYSNSMSSKVVYLEGKDNTITLKLNLSDNKLSTSFDIQETISPFKVKVSEYLIHLLSTIGDNVTMSAKEDCPVYVSTEGDDYVFEYILATLKME
jgi:hypothetical protein